MKEKDFISIIKKISKSSYIGDDCAYLKDLGIVITQDSLVEDVHFKINLITPYQLGYKSIAVNVSDIVASGAEPKYLTISLSLPKNITNEFVEEFYKGVKHACNLFNVELVGGDITGSDKIFISVCAIGKTNYRKISSRSNAKVGYKIVVAGSHGSSGAGLYGLLNNKNLPEKFIKAHLEPVPQIEFGSKISKNVQEDYAMMDTSDGLLDALSAIANESKVKLNIDFDKIPYDIDLEKYFNDIENLILLGGEDYGIVASIPEKYTYGTKIGYITEGSGVSIKKNNIVKTYSTHDVEEMIFNHFKK